MHRVCLRRPHLSLHLTTRTPSPVMGMSHLARQLPGGIGLHGDVAGQVSAGDADSKFNPRGDADPSGPLRARQEWSSASIRTLAFDLDFQGHSVDSFHVILAGSDH